MRTLAFRFNDIVDKIYNLPLEEDTGKLKFSSDINELKNML